MSAPFEFSKEQNLLIGSLAGKMRFVGLFASVVGIINIVIALMVVAAIYRDRFPADWKAKATAAVEQAKDKIPEGLGLDKLPPNNHLWGIAINAGVVGLFYVLMGGWTRSAGSAFQRIVDTQGRDVANLMSGLDSLHKMYSLLYSLLMLIVLLGIASIAITLYFQFVAR